MSKSTALFQVSADARVYYETGAEAIADILLEALPAAVELVEKKQHRPFPAPVKIYVCASIDCLKAYGAPSGREGAFVLNQRVFVSPKPENTAWRLPALLTHELSHLHMEQRLGFLKWNAGTPLWFKEGLTVYVAEGGGAEIVSEEQARRFIAQGRHFVPERSGSLLFPKRAADYDLEPHMFYRQAAMFVDYLAESGH